MTSSAARTVHVKAFALLSKTHGDPAVTGSNPAKTDTPTDFRPLVQAGIER
jgi:hypothetical protein